MIENKIRHGQFYTLRNPFTHPLVLQWLEQIPDLSKARFAEPFGGANHIIRLVHEAFPDVKNSQWTSYDIEPEAVYDNQVPEVGLIRQDTIANPISSDVIITNPPYLAKNSASRRKMRVEFGAYQDLYEVSIDKMLAHAKFVAAIIPESFLTRKLFRDRLFGFISITDSLFDDTEFPVGLALWTEGPHNDFLVYVGKEKVGYFKDIRQRTHLLNAPRSADLKIVFNDPTGILGLHAIDTPSTESIRFTEGNEIASSSIKHTSRAITRISVLKKTGESLVDEENLTQIIQHLNEEIRVYRSQSHDLFLTSFKGIRKDNRYRRRLDWATATLLISAALAKL